MLISLWPLSPIGNTLFEGLMDHETGDFIDRAGELVEVDPERLLNFAIEFFLD